MATNKVRVTTLLGSDSTIGMMDPQINMRVGYGIDTRWIVAKDTGNGQVSLALASGGAVVAKAYPHDLVLLEATATAWGWPDSEDSISFAASGIYPTQVVVDNDVTVMKGNGVQIYAR